MLIKRNKASDISENNVTPEEVYLNRRTIIKSLGYAGLSLAGVTGTASAKAGIFDFLKGDSSSDPKPTKQVKLKYSKDKNEDLVVTPEIKVTTHNNFYEFGANKFDPAEKSKGFKTEPWTLEVEGEVAKPGKLDVWELIHKEPLVERIYRMRCVEAWSMIIPWVGIELGKLLKQFEPTSKAKFVAFETLYDPEQMPGQRSAIIGGGISYPYVEGLRIDEAMNPLTLLSVGIYGKTLPPQNGAPIRLVVPWKYGFKGIKSIVKIKLLETMPPTTWSLLAPNEYGFFANVNPDVSHPRWSQATERFIGDGGFLAIRRQDTLMFNGYEEEVASLYSGMDLAKFY